MNELNEQICHPCAGTNADEGRSNADNSSTMADIFEPVVGLVSMSRICAYLVRRNDPDLAELRNVIGLLVTSSEKVLEMIQSAPPGEPILNDEIP